MRIRCTRLGLFGGTFNPIHMGHLRLAEEVREEYCLDYVVFIPANRPPHKKLKEEISPSHRLKMVESAINSNNHFMSDDMEVKRGGISYTIDTVNYVYENYEFEEKPYFIIGSDLLGEIDTWKDIDILMSKLHFIVMLRTGAPQYDYKAEVSSLFKRLGSEHWVEHPFLFFEKRKLNITSSEIREKLKQKKSIRYLVTDGVLKYIKEKELYRI